MKIFSILFFFSFHLSPQAFSSEVQIVFDPKNAKISPSLSRHILENVPLLIKKEKEKQTRLKDQYHRIYDRTDQSHNPKVILQFSLELFQTIQEKIQKASDDDKYLAIRKEDGFFYLSEVQLSDEDSTVNQ